MHSRQQEQNAEHPVSLPAGRLFRDMVAGMLPGLLLCSVLVGTLKGNVADAAPEMYLAAQDITLSGNVTTPSCAVKLENDRMTFSRQQDDRYTARSLSTQTLRLDLSQCEADGVGVMFKAEHWPENPVRGSLRGTQSTQRDGNWYYTISPGAESDSGDMRWPLRLAKDSVAPEADKQSGENNKDVYFSLAEVNYWYDLNAPLKESDVLVIPFSVQVHQAPTRDRNIRKEDDETLESNFTLQLSWR